MFRLLTKARPAIVLGSTAFILRNAPSAWDYLTSTLGPAAVCGNGTEVPCAPAVMPWGGTGKKPVPKYGRTRGHVARITAATESLPVPRAQTVEANSRDSSERWQWHGRINSQRA